MMKERKKIKYLHAGQYVAEVEVSLIDDETGWSPYLNLKEARKLDEVRDALQKGDLETALRYGKVYELRQVMGKY